jgi:hypothetical protein
VAKIGNPIHLICFISFLCLANLASADPVVQATVPQTNFQVGEAFELTVSVISSKLREVSEPQLPQLSDFELLNSGTSSSTSTKLMKTDRGMEFVSQRRVDFVYVISAVRTGRLTIPAFEVVVDEKSYSTKPIVLEISQEPVNPGQGSGVGRGSGSGQGPGGFPQILDDPLSEADELFNQLLQRRGLVPPSGVPRGGIQGGGRLAPQREDPDINTRQAFFILLETDKTEVYEGEQITAEWYIYTRGKILSLDRLKFPDLKGFWKEIIEEVPALNFSQEIVNGVPFQKALLASHALFPIKAGEAVIDEYKIKARVQTPSAFGAFGMGDPYTYTRSSQARRIKVKPLPLEGRPADFAGAVGQFSVTAKVDEIQYPVNQPFSVKVRFEGSGNAKLIELPSIQWPSTVEVYDTKVESRFFKNGKAFKEFEVLLIPRAEGALTIPELSFSMFDPSIGKYVTRRTTPIQIQITAGASGGNSGSQRLALGSAAKTGKALALPDLVLDQKAGVPWTAGWPLVWITTLGSLLALAHKVKREFWTGSQVLKIEKQFLKRWKTVEKLLQKSELQKASAEVLNCVYFVLGAVLNRSGASVEIEKLLEEVSPSLRRDFGDQMKDLIQYFQTISFAPRELSDQVLTQRPLNSELSKAKDILLRVIRANS